MDNDVVIKVDGLYKKFCRNLKRSMLYAASDTLKSFVSMDAHTESLRKDEFWALEDVSFEVKKGETLGIIGVNGSGKSTLLRVLTGIFPPDKGKVLTKGRVGSLIAVGAGFHPHMTGKENIYLNGILLGMSKQEIKEKFDEIVEFSEIGEFLNAPVSTYSSGMKVRLGFAIAINVQPEILLVDEVLSVGDLGFRNKSMRKMAELRGKANAQIFISHNLEHIRNICDRLLILNRGKIVYTGDTYEGLVHYEELNRDIRLNKIDNRSFANDGESSYEIYIDSIEVVNELEHEVDELEMNCEMNINLYMTVNKDCSNIYFSFALLNDENRACIWIVSNDNEKVDFGEIKKGKYKLKIKIPQHHLVPGVYYFKYAVRNGITGETFEKINTKKSFRIRSNGKKLERGIVNVNEEWLLEKIN